MRMLKLLQQKRTQGVIIHKIDRWARNLKDWALLGELIDAGVDVHFANENLDLQSRGGRLTADIQAVVASDFIRNLREEVRKGFYGRIKQGFYPLPAPLGYMDCGSGQLKQVDPFAGPLVRLAFEWYASGTFSLMTLCRELNRRGLRTRTGRPLTATYLSRFLKNPFYTGVIRIKKAGLEVPGKHCALVSPDLFLRVQQQLKRRKPTAATKHLFLFQRMLQCHHCGYSLIGELQKGRIYYRCHTKRCPTKTVREDVIEDLLLTELALKDDKSEVDPILNTLI